MGDDINEQVIEIITNQITWTANTIGELYKSRWQIEIFFREIKQLLHIKSFIGTSHNAVMIQGVMDSINNNTHFKGNESDGQVQLAFIKSGCIFKTQFICQNKP